MATTWKIDVTDAFVFVQVVGDYAGADDMIAGMQLIIERCREARRWRVLIDVTGLRGEIPQLDRFLLGKRAARMWGQRMRVAIFTRSQETNRFFENVATNDGANVHVFRDRAAAEAWLQTNRLMGAS